MNQSKPIGPSTQDLSLLRGPSLSVSGKVRCVIAHLTFKDLLYWVADCYCSSKKDLVYLL